MENNNIIDEKDFAYEESEENEQNELKRYQINSYSVDRAVETLIKWKRNNKLVVPDFQRDYVWSFSNCARLIDSILLNLPIPNIFVFKIVEKGEEKYILVDGMQRITTIDQFESGTWKQSGKERKFKINLKTSNWHNKGFSNLDESDKQFFYDYPLSVMIFETSAKSDSESKNVIFSVFERINTGSEKLTEQEIRNTLYQGICLDKLKEVVSTKDVFYRLIQLDSGVQKRGKDLEFLLRLMSYYHVYNVSKKGVKYLVNDDEESKITTSKTVMLNNYLYYSNKGDIEYINQLTDILEALATIEQLDKTALYCVKRDKSGIGTKVHQIFAEALVIATILNNNTIPLSKEQFNENKLSLWKSEEYFYKTFTEKTTDPDNVVARIDKMIRFINGEEIWKS